MASPQKTDKRVSFSASISSRKITPAVPEVPVHSVKVADDKSNRSKNFGKQQLAAGSRAADKNDFVEAIKQFSLSRSETTTSLYLRGCARLELKQYSETRKAIEDFNYCIELSSQTTQPSIASELWYKRALAYQNIGKNDDALRDYTEFINHSRSLGEKGKDNLHKGLLARGLTYHAMREFDMALHDINQANKLTNNLNPYYLCCRASIYSSKHEYAKATEDLESASKIGGNQDTEALLQRAFVFSELEKHDDALQDLKRALQLSQQLTQKAEIWFRCGISRHALQNRERALQSFEQAIKLNPFHARAHFRIGMIQAEKGQFKDALKTLTKAHELAPHQSDILLERAIVNRRLGYLDDAADDEKHGMQLDSSPSVMVAMLEDRIKKLREEIDLKGESARSHLELGIAYDGLLTEKKGSTAKLEYFKEAVIEYTAAIETDQENYYPQARALLALCQKKMNDFVDAHRWHMEFYNVLRDHKEAVHLWIAFLEEVKETKELGKLEPHLDETAVRKLIEMEVNRQKMNVDVKEFENDKEDIYKNQLTFYERLRIDLSNLLSAIALSSLDNDIIAHNLEGTPGKVGEIIGVLSGTLSLVPEIGSILSGDDIVSAAVLQTIDYDFIKKKLKAIGSVGDMTEQLEVAQLVARHLCTRYRSQLLCLKSNNDSKIDTKDPSQEPMPSCWWRCCGSERPSSRQASFSDGNEPTETIAIFAVAFIIQAIQSHTMKVSWKNKNFRKEKKEALATALILTVSDAHHSKPRSTSRSHDSDRKDNLLIDPSAVLKMLKKMNQPTNEAMNASLEWYLYEFFRGPGIYYYSKDDTEEICYYDLGPSMRPRLYGYRLGTVKEVDRLKKLNEKKK